MNIETIRATSQITKVIARDSLQTRSITIASSVTKAVAKGSAIRKAISIISRIDLEEVT